MENYILVLRSKNGSLRIGRKRYNKADAVNRVDFLKSIGINMEIMTEQEVFRGK